MPPNMILGLLFLAICLITYVSQTFVVGHLQTSLKYTQSYFLLWTTHSSQIFVFPLTLIYLKLFKKASFRSTLDQVKTDCCLNFGSKNWKSKSFFLVSMAALILTSGFYMWYYSAALTDLTTLTVIYNTNCFFAYLFSVILRLESLTLRKVGSLLLAIGGVLIVVLINKPTESQDLSKKTLGNIMVSISSVLVGLYEVVYTVFFCKQETSSTFTTFISSYIGFVTMTLFSLFIPVLHFLDIERFLLPNKEQLMYLTINIILGVLYNTSFFALIEKTSPLFTSVGLILVVPVTPIVEKLLNTRSGITWNIWLGALIVFFSFFIMVLPSRKHVKSPCSSSK